MTLSLVRPGDRAVLLCYLGPPRLDRVPKGIAVVISSERVSDTPASLVAARKVAGLPADAPIGVAGYSGGCQAVRALLLAAGPDAADAWVTIDGTSDSVQLSPTRVEAWRRLAAAARASRTLWVATCIQQDYTERLATAPHASTRRVLEAATGLDLRGPMTRPPSGVKPGGGYTGLPAAAELAHRYVDGALVVESYASSSTDAAEHAAQAAMVYPRLVQDVVGPWLLERRAPAGEPGAGWAARVVDFGRRALEPLQALGGWILLPRSLGARAVDVALDEMRRGATEKPVGSNAGPDIEEYLRRCERDGRPLGLKAGNYCAAGACWAYMRALGAGEKMPFPYRASGLEMTEDAKARGAWRPIRDVKSGAYKLRVGDIVIYPRGKPGSWERHVVMVREPRGVGPFKSIEANSPVGWSSQDRLLDDAFGVIAGP